MVRRSAAAAGVTLLHALRRAVAGAGWLALLGACVPAAARAPHVLLPQPLRLSFIADFNPPRLAAAPQQSSSDGPAPRWDAALGGLSGLYYNPRDSLLYAISDSSQDWPPRLYTFAVELSETALQVVPHSVILLREREPTGTLLQLDAESLTADPSGAFWIGTENSDDRPTQRWPHILRVSREGLVTSGLDVPAAFLPELEAVPSRGTRTNLAFEGLASSPSGKWLCAITEAALRQDGPLANVEQGTRVRLLRWELSTGRAPAEFRYQTEPVPRPPSGPAAAILFNGVSELTSLDDQRLLVLERAYVAPAEGLGFNTVRIFEVSLPPGSAGDASGPQSAAPIAKRLVLDLDDVLGRLQPGLQSLDNFEGMTIGPTLPSGTRSLLLVSDDNFSAYQRTVFLAFRVIE